MQKVFAIFALALSLDLALGQKCVTVKNLPGECKRPLDCPEIAILMKLTNPTKEERAFLKNSTKICGKRDKIPYVCCSLLPQSCGVQLVDKIIGGQEARLMEYPWTAMLMYETFDVKSAGCGGALISSRYVLTAAHCVTGLRSGRHLVNVRLGEHDVRKDSDCDDTGECTTHVDVGIETVFINKNFSARNMSSDIALLRLSKEVQITDHIQPICLPSSAASYDHKNLWVAGWGKTDSGKASHVKMKVDIPVMPHLNCKRVYANQPFPQIISTNQICAGGVAGKDSCAGDSGAPLMYETNEGGFPHWQAVGIVSYGPNACGKEGIPGVYTKVYDFIEWIYKNIEP